MKTTILAFVFLLFGNVFVYSQSVGNEKLSVSVDLGSGSFFGHLLTAFIIEVNTKADLAKTLKHLIYWVKYFRQG